MSCGSSRRIVSVALCAVALSAVGAVAAQAEEPFLNHLIPAQNGARVAASPLLPGPESGTMAAVYCSVPLGAPWAVAIRASGGSAATLEFRRARYVGYIHRGELEKSSSEIPIDLAVVASQAIDKMVRDARDPEHEPMPKREAATVYFISYRGGAARTAWTLSPHPTSSPGRLMELARALLALSRHPDARRAESAKRLARELLQGSQK